MLSLVPDGRIALNAAAVRIARNSAMKSVLLLWDKTNNKLALKATHKDDRNAYAVTIIRDGTSGSLRAKSFLRYVGWSAPKRTMLPANWNEAEKMFEVVLPGEFVGAQKQGTPRQKPWGGAANRKQQDCVPTGKEADSMRAITRKMVREIKPKLAEAVRRADYEGFKEILSLAGIPLGSDEFRSYEAQFWRAVSEHRKSKQQSP